MSGQRLLRLLALPLLGAAAGALVTAAVIPIAVAHADDCDSGACTLVSGGEPTDIFYSGFRPIVTDWADNQPVNVEVTPSDGGAAFVSGSYNVSEADYKWPVYDISEYHYGTFTPAADNPDGSYSDGLSGASVYDFRFGPGMGATSTGQLGDVPSGQPGDLADYTIAAYPNGAFTGVLTVPGEFQNVFEFDGTGAADFIYYAGQDKPVMLFDTLYDPAPLQAPDLLPPDVYFAGDQPVL